MSNRTQHFITIAAVLFVALLLLGGCATPGAAPLARQLPPAPASMAPVAVPAVKSGADVRASLYEHRSALASANRRLVASRKWYGAVAKEYSKSK